MDQYIKVVILDSLFESQILGEVMKDRGIPHLIKSYYDSAYDGIFQGQKGWGAVFAPPEYSIEIKEIIEELRNKG